MRQNGNPKPLLGCSRVSLYHQCRWLRTPATAMAGSDICWGNTTLPRTSPSIPGKRPAWRPPDFTYPGDHLICPQGKILRRGAYHKRQRYHHYVARRKDCQACPIKDNCLPPGQKRRFIGVTINHPEYPRARERNRIAAYRRERVRCRTVMEGTFASLDRLGWEKSRLRGLWRVD